MSKKAKKVSKIVQNSLTKIVFVDKSITKEEKNEFEFVSIKTPRKSSTFIFSNSGEKIIYEVLQFNEKHRSWFLDNTVCSNGKLYLTSRIDPMFIFIQYIEEHSKTRAQPLDQIFAGNETMFLEYFTSSQMKMVADQKGPEDLKAFIYNEQKTLKWLKKKFTLIMKSLTEQNIISTGATSSNYVKSTAPGDAIDEDAVKETALGIIQEYISLDLYEKLDTFYGITAKSEEKNSQKRKSEVTNGKQPDSKKIKMENQENSIDENVIIPVKAPPKQSNKDVKLLKASKGTKSISSFFAKK
ncbi:unnamed protein product [Diamesa hyperborea]